ncbi:hypothetical protein VQ071_22710 [Cohnella sp. 56]|uniref:hypothetical protein n=1 Tax=Cohnella sp. 56 TaxID=3113722 RepID=UPI0030E787FB
MPRTDGEGALPIPLIVRATFNATGAITFTGNTLGLSRSDTAGVPGTLDSIGAFATINASSQYGSYPAGTTSNYVNNSAAAIDDRIDRRRSPTGSASRRRATHSPTSRCSILIRLARRLSRIPYYATAPPMLSG